MVIVQIEKPANKPLAAWFSELRTWLDKHNCEPLEFAQTGRVINRLIFQMAFADSATAQIFISEFGKYSARVRRLWSEGRALNQTAEASA